MSAQGEANRSASAFRATLGSVPNQIQKPQRGGSIQGNRFGVVRIGTTLCFDLFSIY